jgi:HPt (histidine-containing phosphotransfer) domain-containing protein
MTTIDEQTQALLRTIWARRRSDVLERVTLIEATLVGDASDAERVEATRQAHMLAGSAGTFGFPRATDLARVIEQALERGAAVDDELRATAARLRTELEGEPGP